MADEIVLNVFGCPTVHHPDGREIRFRTKKQLGLFVYLAIETRDRTVSREALVELFWSDTDPRRGRHSLSQAFSTIRDRFGPDSLTRGSGPVKLRVPVVTELEQIDAQHVPSNRLLRPLDDLESAGGNDFSHWVDSVRTALSQRAKLSLESALADAAGAGSVDRVREHAAQLYRVDPLSRPAVAALTDELLEQGDSAGAIQLLQQYRDRFSETIGNAPPGIDHRLDRIRSEIGSRVNTHDPDFSAPVEFFVGRNEEVAGLEGHWAEAQLGQVIAVAVHGNPGIGKSTLLRRFVESVRDRAWPSFFISCPEIGEHIPYGATSELIRALMRDPGMSGTDPMWLAEASRVFPGLRSKYSGIPEAPTVPPEAVRLRVAEALSRMIDAVAENGPVLIAIDDLHQMDPTSRDVLHLLIRRRAGKSTMLLCSARTPALRGLAANDEDPLAAVEWTKKIALDRLPDADTHDIITRLSAAAHAPPSTVRSEIVRMAEGNPYLTAMLVSDWQQDPENSLVTAELRGDATSADWNPPDRMRQAFARQHRGLSQEAEHILNLLAVTGRNLEGDAVETVLGMEHDTLNRGVLELIRRGLVRHDNTGLTFKNEMHGRFVYYAMEQAERSYLHEHVARELPHRGNSFQLLLEAALHSHKGGDHPTARRMAAEGAAEAIARGAAAEAEASLESILTGSRLHDDSSLFVLLAEAKNELGKHQECIETLDNIETLSLPTSWKPRAAVLRTEAHYRGGISSITDLSVHAADSERLARAANDEDLAIRALQTRAEIAADNVDHDTLAEVENVAQELGGKTASDRTRARARVTEAFCHLVGGDYQRASSLLQSAVHILHAERLDGELRKASNGLGICLTNLGRYDDAERTFRQAIQLGNQVGDPGGVGVSWNNLGVAYHDLGHFVEARSAFISAAKAYSDAARPRIMPDLFFNAASLAMTLGNVEEATAMLVRAGHSARKLALPGHHVAMLIAKADLQLSKREFENAWAIVEELLVATRDATPLDASSIQLERLRRFYFWATRGYNELERIIQPLPHRGIGNRLAELLEIQGLQEWIELQEGVCKQPGHTQRRISHLGLFGVAARLITAGVFPGSPSGDGSSARQVTGIFPECHRRIVPTDVGVLQ